MYKWFPFLLTICYLQQQRIRRIKTFFFKPINRSNLIQNKFKRQTDVHCILNNVHITLSMGGGAVFYKSYEKLTGLETYFIKKDDIECYSTLISFFFIVNFNDAICKFVNIIQYFLLKIAFYIILFCSKPVLFVWIDIYNLL